MNLKSLAEYLRLSPEYIRRKFRTDYKDMPRTIETIKILCRDGKNRGVRRFKFIKEDVLKFIEEKFN